MSRRVRALRAMSQKPWASGLSAEPLHKIGTLVSASGNTMLISMGSAASRVTKR
jgi:hypothetical protein